MGLRSRLAHAFGFGPRTQPKASFEAARRGRLTFDFMAGETSADAEIKGDLVRLRNRARALSRDNVHARAIKRTYRVNIFGSRGIRMQPQIRKVASDELDKLRNDAVLKEYRLWCRRESCDVAGINTFHAHELDIASALVDGGELFFRIVRGRQFGASRVPFALEVIEADHLDVNCNGISDIAGRVWRMGVERDEWNRATRYKFLRRHPGDYELSYRPDDRNEKYLTLPAADVIHVYGVRDRVGQTRMEPILTPVIPVTWHGQKYRESHLMRKRVQANQLGFIQTPDGVFQPDEVDNVGRKIIESSAGQYIYGDPGQTFHPPDFGPEDTQFPEVLKANIRDQATGAGCSYATISKDYSDANYSSLKISTSEDRDWWMTMQTAIIEQFHQRVFEEWMYAAVMYGVLPSPTFDDYWIRPERYTMPRWQTRTWQPLDETKAANAMKVERELQLKSHGQQIMEHTGDEYEDVIARIEFENNDKRDRDLITPVDDPTMETRLQAEQNTQTESDQ